MSIKMQNLSERRISAGSIRLDTMGSRSDKDMVISEYEVQETPERITNPLGHLKGFCKMPSWLVFVIANAVLLVCIVSIGVVLGLTLTKTISGGTCTKDADCDSSIGLICSGGKCDCPSSKYWDDSKLECTVKKKLNSTCASAKECDDRVVLTCVDPTNNQANTTIFGTGVCACSSGLYWNGSICIAISSSNGLCYPSLKVTGCDTSLGLYCDNATKSCICDATKQFWSGSICANYRSYYDSCQANTWCTPGTNLFCQTQGATAGQCDCATKNYWDGSKCASVVSYSVSCLYTQQCDTSLSLYCATSGSLANKCDCPTNMYWTGTKCAAKLSINGTCTSNSTCDITLLLYCISGKCQCSSLHYWDTYSASCLPKKAVSGSCSSSTTCDANANLVCTGTGGTVGSCACPTTSFWNGTACVLKLLWKVSCSSNVQCNDFKSLVCTNTSQFSSSFICDCGSYTLYYDGTTCSSKKPNLSPCTSTYECQDYNLLYCSNTKCICPNSHYWDVNTCVQKRLYTVPCLYSGQCDDLRYLYCPTTIGGCNCPFTSNGYYCDCNSTSYWDSTATTCTPRGSYTATCPLGNYQCLTANTGLSCTSGICDCPPKSQNWFWNGAKCKQCPNGWTIVGQYCYYKTPFSTDWNTAKQYCKTFGGTLMVINDQTELNSFMINGIKFLANNGDTANIGANSQAVAGSWFWENSASLSTSSSWWCNPPSGDACAAIRNNNGVFCIEDVPCGGSYASICEVA